MRFHSPLLEVEKFVVFGIIFGFWKFYEEDLIENLWCIYLNSSVIAAGGAMLCFIFNISIKI